LRKKKNIFTNTHCIKKYDDVITYHVVPAPS